MRNAFTAASSHSSTDVEGEDTVGELAMVDTVISNNNAMQHPRSCARSFGCVFELASAGNNQLVARRGYGWHDQERVEDPPNMR